MRFALGRVVGGKVVIEGEPLEDGTAVTVVAFGKDEEPALTPALRAELSRAIGEIEAGDWVALEEVLRVLRS